MQYPGVAQRGRQVLHEQVRDALVGDGGANRLAVFRPPLHDQMPDATSWMGKVVGIDLRDTAFVLLQDRPKLIEERHFVSPFCFS